MYVMDYNNCKADTMFFVPEVPLIFPKFFTPNSDSRNDRWIIGNIEFYPGSELTIYNRFGKTLLETVDAAEGWDGEYLDKRMPSDDYWYILRVKETNKEYIGHFTLMR
jgi:gliding motility-associated-like protein